MNNVENIDYKNTKSDKNKMEKSIKISKVINYKKENGFHISLLTGMGNPTVQPAL